ncbi:unnamed protein product [Haemonchus placei]|uniref:Methyl-accepting chemotaxis protein n=1 Tax=Haemonchus placei TaxID=6290 RepID=A0A0N4X397_HAEPC|nr:unnamed protein product [Haemonchus placei]
MIKVHIGSSSRLTKEAILESCRNGNKLVGAERNMTEDKYNIPAGYLETAFNSKTDDDSLSSLSSAVSYIYTTANSEHLSKVVEMMAAATNEMVQTVDRLNEATTGLSSSTEFIKQQGC